MIDDDIPALTQFTQLFTNKNAQNIEKRHFGQRQIPMNELSEQKETNRNDAMIDDSNDGDDNAEKELNGMPTSTKGKYHIEDDDNQDGGEYLLLKDEEMSNDARLDELLQKVPLNEQQNAMFNYLQKGIYYPFIAQWRNTLVSAIKENVVVKSVAQFNPYFGCVMIVEPLYEFEDVGGSSAGAGSDTEEYGKRKKKTKKVSVSDLTSTGYYALAVDLYGLKKKSVIGRILDDHRKFVKRCVLANYIKCCNEINYLEICRHECETRIPNLSSITDAFSNTARIKSSDDAVLKKIVDIFQSYGGRAPQKQKKIEVANALTLETSNKRLTFLCPESTGCINDLPSLVKYVTTCMSFPFEAKVTTRYSFLSEQQVEFHVQITSVNYRCKQGVILKGTILSGQLEPLDYKFMVKSDNNGETNLATSSDNNIDPVGKRRRIITNIGTIPFNSFNGREIKVEAAKLKLCGEISEVNQKILSDYQLWFCHGTLLDEKKLDDQWNNLRYFLQFIQ